MRRFSIGLPWFLASLALAAVAAPHPARGDDHRDEAERRSLLARAAGSGRAGTFVSAAILADLVGPLKGAEPLTVLVPTDEAFAKLPAATRQALFSPGGAEKLQAILRYHVLPGRVLARQLAGEARPKAITGERWTVASNDRGVAINNATVVEADVLARNGVIHFVDAVLTPPAPDVLGLAERAGQFGTLRKLVEAAGLEDALRADGPFTVFAPTDEAFEALGRKTLATLLEAKNRDKLREILKYHVVAGRVSARDAVAAGEAKTLQGEAVPVSIKAGRVAIGPATARATDLEAANGVVHAIDAVLVPDARK